MSSVIAPDTSLSLEQALALLKGDDAGQRYYAAWYLGYLENPVAVEPLIEALRDGTDRTELGGYPLKRRAAESLGRIGDGRAVPALVEALQCEDIQTRECAAWALGELGDRRSGEGLLAVLASGGSQPYEAIIEALGDLKIDAAAPLIRPFLQEQPERIRYAAARATYQLTGDTSVISELFAGLNHKDVHLRRAALFDLAATGYLPSAQPIVDSDLTTNIKLIALKKIVDASDTEDLGVLGPILKMIDDLL